MYKVTIERLDDNGHGEIGSASFQSDDLSWALAYAFCGIHDSRPLGVLADLVENVYHMISPSFREDLPPDVAEIAFVDAAAAVVSAWSKHDKELDEALSKQGL